MEPLPLIGLSLQHAYLRSQATERSFMLFLANYFHIEKKINLCGCIKEFRIVNNYSIECAKLISDMHVMISLIIYIHTQFKVSGVNSKKKSAVASTSPYCGFNTPIFSFFHAIISPRATLTVNSTVNKVK